MAAELPRPGVEIIQVFRTVTPTVVTPTLTPCVVGVAKQLVDVLVPNGSGGSSLNNDANVDLPAFFISADSGMAFMGLDGLTLGLSLNNGPEVQTTFEDSGAGLTAADVVSQINKAFDTASVTGMRAVLISDTRFEVRSVGTGEFETLYVTATTDIVVADTFTIGIGKTYTGLNQYNQFEFTLPPIAYPDPRNNLAELAIEFDTVRVFLSTHGAGVGLFECKRTEAFLQAATTAVEAIDDGNGDVVTTLLDFGVDFTTASTFATLTGVDVIIPANLNAGDTFIISDGTAPQTIVFTGAEATPADVIDRINAVISPLAGGKITASNNGMDYLVLTHSDRGEQSVINILGGSSLAALDSAAMPSIVVSITRGQPFQPLPGDDLYLDGVFFAVINQTAPGGVVNRLRINRQVAIDASLATSYSIIGKNLPVNGSPSRPYPNLQVDTEGNLTIKHDILRDPFGVILTSRAPVYATYTAVREDVSPLAATPGLLTFNNTIELEDAMAPISADNPLGLGLFFALLNAAGTQVMGLGVDEISADEPFGTLEGFTRSAEYLESFEVYALAPLTHNDSVAQVMNEHVNLMSGAQQKGERIVLFNPSVPVRAIDKLVASGTHGDRLSNTVFDTKIAALSQLVQDAGISPVGTITTDKGLFLDLQSDGKHYSIKTLSSGQVTIRITFDPGDNDDGFYSVTNLPTPLIDETFAVRVRGAELLNKSGKPDKQAISETMQALGQSFSNRRFWLTFPDKCAAVLTGIEQVLEGFYMNAAIAGMIAQQPPQQSFTNFPMVGFTRVIGSNDTFSERNLNVMAAGGVYILVQDGRGLPVISRMSLTTDMTSIETRTDSVTKVADFTSKFLRRALRNFIGRFNITQGFLDSLGSVVQGLIGFLVENGILIGGNLNNVIQDEDAPDTVLLDLSIDVPLPCNTLRLVLAI